MTNLCGHDRDVLILALGDLAHLDNDILVGLAQIPEALPEWRNAVLDLVDPAKLVEMLAARGRELGLPDIVVRRIDAHDPGGNGTAGILIVFGQSPKRMCMGWPDKELSCARAILLQWLQLPDGAREEAERVLRGNHADPDELINTIPMHERIAPRRFDPDPDRGRE